MFRKLGKALGGGGKSQTIKVRFDLQVVQVDRLPTAVRKCRVVWARNAKVQMTAVKEVRNGVATFKQTLTQVSTVQRDKAGHFEPKEYTVKVQVPQGSGNETVGKATIDLAQFVGDANNTQTDTIPITFSAGGTSTGYVKVVITATHMGDMSEDGLTEVSGMTGLTSDGPHHAEQDLEGFDETSSSKVSDRKGTTHKPEKFGQRGRAQQLPAMQEEGSMDEQFTPAPAASKSQKPEVNFGKRAAASKPAPRPTWHDDEDVSSVDSELEDDPPPRPPPKPEPKQKKGLLGLMQAPEEEEEPARQKRPPATAPVARQPEPDLADMKSALFGKTAVAAMAASKAGQPTSPEKARSVGSGSRGPAAVPAEEEEEEEAQRAALFGTKAKPASSKRAALGASSKAPTSLPEPEGRAALPTKPAGSKGSSSTAVNGVDDDDTSALSTTPQPASVRPPKLEPGSDTLSRKPSHAAAKPPMPTTSRRGAFGREAAAGSEDEASIVSASTATQASGQRSQLAAAAAPGASSGGELQQVMSENSQLKAQLQQSLQTEVVLRQQLDQAEVTICNLNKRIAEVDVDPAELYQQMQELEVKHKTAMSKLQEQVDELEQELEEAQAAAARQNQAKARALSDREAALQQLEAKAQAQLADANRMLDQSMVAAVKNQQERKALQEEVERLKQQLASQPARQDDDLVEELQEQVAALQKEVEELQKASEVAQQAAAQLLEDVHGLLDEAGVAVPALEGMDALASLNPSVMALCKAFQVKAVDVEDLQQRVLQLADTDDTSKVSELETQLAHVTQLNSKMQEALQQSQQECSELQQQVARMSPRQSRAGAAGSTSAAVMSVLLQLEQENKELASAKQQLAVQVQALEAQISTVQAIQQQQAPIAPSSRTSSSPSTSRVTELEQEVEELRYQLQQSRLSAEANSNSLLSELRRLTQEVRPPGRASPPSTGPAARGSSASPTKQHQGLPTSPGSGRKPTEGGTMADVLTQLAVLSAQVAEFKAEASQQGQENVALHKQLAAVQQEKAELEAKMEDFEQAEQIIKEWSDYADTLTAERDELKGKVEMLQSQGAQLLQGGVAGGKQNHVDVAAAGTAAAGKQASKAVDLQEMVHTLRAQLQQATELAQKWEAEAQAAKASAAHLESKCTALQQAASTSELGWSAREAQLQEELHTAVGAQKQAEEQQQLELAAAQALASSFQARLKLEEPFQQALGKTETLKAQHAALVAQVQQLEGALKQVHRVIRADVKLGSRSQSTDYESDSGSEAGGLPGNRPQLNLRPTDIPELALDSRPAPEADQAQLVVAMARRDELLAQLLTACQQLVVIHPAQPSKLPTASRSSSKDIGEAGIGMPAAAEFGSLRHFQERVKALTEWRSQAEDSMSSLQSQQQELQAQRDQAVAAAAAAEATRSLLQSQLDAQLEVHSAATCALQQQLAVLQSQLQAHIPPSDLHGAGQSVLEECSSSTTTPPRTTDSSSGMTAGRTPDSHLSAPLSTSQAASQAGIGDRGRPGSLDPSDLHYNTLRNYLYADSLGQPSPASGKKSLQAATPHPAPPQLLVQLQGQLNTAAEAVFGTRQAVSSCFKAISSQEPSSVVEDVELDVALLLMKDEAFALAAELRRQAAMAPHFQSQVAAAQERVAELEAQVEELQSENNILAGGGLHLAAYCADPCSAHSGSGTSGHLATQQQLHGLGTSAREGGAGARAALARGGPASRSPSPLMLAGSYADDAGLTISAWEQQMAMKENAAVEAEARAEALRNENARLTAALNAARAAAVVTAAAAGEQAGPTSRPGSRLAMRRGLKELSDDDDSPVSSLAARKADKERAALQLELSALRGQCDKLEAVCADQKTRAAAERAGLERQLAEVQTALHQAQAELAAAKTALAAATEAAAAAAASSQQAPVEAAGSGQMLAELQDQMRKAERQISRLVRDNESLSSQLKAEAALRERLEGQVVRGLENMGDDEAIEAVEAFEEKYKRLRERYRQLEAASAEELDELAEQLSVAQQQLQQAQSASAGNSSRQNGVAPNVGAPGAGSSREALERENQALVVQLVNKQLEAAQLAEDQAMLRRELYRVKEVNMKLATKMTTLEAQAYSSRDSKKKGGKGAGNKSNGSDKE